MQLVDELPTGTFEENTDIIIYEENTYIVIDELG